MMKKTELNEIKQRLAFSPAFVVIYLLLMAILCSLGVWQLQRADEKALYLQQRNSATKGQVIDLNNISDPDLQTLEYHFVSVKGTFDGKHQFLIDNQVRKGKAGYFVMTPMLIDGFDQGVLVNRGWVPMSPDRSIQQSIDLINLHGSVTGRVNHFPSVGLQLTGADIPTDDWPATVQVINHEILAGKLGYPLLNFQIEMNPNYPDGFLREWAEKKIILPQQHVAYAVQWFGLALTLTILLMWISKKNDTATKEK